MKLGRYRRVERYGLVLLLPCAFVFTYINTYTAVLEIDCNSTSYRTYPRDGVGTTVNVSSKFFPDSLQSLCKVKNLTAVVPVNSAVKNFIRRKALRTSLTRMCAVYNCKAFFLVGSSFNETDMQLLKEEIYTHGDILMVEKEDTYHTISNKLVAMLKWLNTNCTQAKYVIFGNDDTFVNVHLFMTELEASGGEKCNCIIGNFQFSAPVRRETTSRWYVSEEDYPCSAYPAYCLGPAYAFPNVLTSTLLTGIYDAPYVWPDDVWLTGLVRDHVGINIKHYNSRRMLDTYKPLEIHEYTRFLFIHNVTEEQQRDAYDIIINGKTLLLYELSCWTFVIFCLCVMVSLVVYWSIINTDTILKSPDTPLSLDEVHHIYVPKMK